MKKCIDHRQRTETAIFWVATSTRVYSSIRITTTAA